MKKALIVFVVSLFAVSGLADVSGRASAGSSQEKDSISFIRARYTAINKNLAKYRALKKELSGFSTEGGELTAYFDGPRLVKIATTNNGETNSFFEEFYYSNDELIFVYRKQEIYDEPMSKVVKTKESRFYFSGGKLIRWINENGKQVGAGNSQYPERQIHYLAASKLFTAGARSRGPVVEAPEPGP
jgi:asparagine N-glycosylation enzyme membrane subunit Stt3